MVDWERVIWTDEGSVEIGKGVEEVHCVAEGWRALPARLLGADFQVRSKKCDDGGASRMDARPISPDAIR